MRNASLVLLILFVLSAVVHLYFCFTEKDKYRKLTKPLCLAFLGTAAALYVPDKPLIYIGAYCGLIGDIFLLNKKNNKYFAAGTIFFIAGHILYAIQIASLLPYQIPWWVYLIIGLAGALISGLVLLKDKKYLGKYAFPANLYIYLLLFMFAFGIVFTVSVPSKIYAGLLVTFGYLAFISSDTTLIITKFVKDIKRRDFYIMITYLTAELLILLGLCLFYI